MPESLHVLVLTADPWLVNTLNGVSRELGIEAQPVDDCDDLSAQLDHAKYEGVMLDFDTVSDARSALARVRESRSNKSTIVFAVASSPQKVEEALEDNAHFLLWRPIEYDGLKETLSSAYDLMLRERRKSFRCSVTLPVLLTSASGMNLECATINVSSNGMAVASPVPFNPGDAMQIALLLPGGFVVRGTGIVIWDDKHGKSGLHFKCSSPTMRNMLNSWLDSVSSFSKRMELVQDSMSRVIETSGTAITKYFRYGSRILLSIFMVLFSVCALKPSPLQAQDSPEITSYISATNTQLSRVIKLTGLLQNTDNTPRTTLTSVTLNLFDQAEGGTPIWSETQQVQPDSGGRFSILLGATQAAGLPVSLFATEAARWVEIVSPGLAPVARIPLVSVPYALKAGDAETLGGHSVSDFVLAKTTNMPSSGAVSMRPAPIQPIPVGPGVWPDVREFRAPTFVSTSTTGPSLVSVATSGPPLAVSSDAMVQNLNSDLLHGFSDSAFAKLSFPNVFSQSQSLQGGFTLPATVPDPNNSALLDSAPSDWESSARDPNTGMQTTQRFRWQSSPVSGGAGSNAQLSLMFGVGSAAPTNTGLSFNSDGTINFAPGQQFPAAAVPAVAASSTTQTNSGAGGVPTSAPVVPTASYSWTQTPAVTSATTGTSIASGSTLEVGPNTVTLTPCPRGVNGNDLWHYLYVSGTGTPEAVLISGGTCVSGAASGTIQFTAQYAHASGYVIGSASDGVQEAIIDAKTTAQTSRNVIISPGTHVLHARVSVRASGMNISSTGAILACQMSDTCLMLGDPSIATAFDHIALSGIRFQPGVVNGTWPAIEDNAQSSTLSNIGTAAGGIQGASFGYLAQIDNDQAALITGLDTSLAAWSRCDSSFCSSAIYGPGPFSKNAGVIWVQNSNLSLSCKANGIDNFDGNTLQVSNSVVQAYAQFGIRSYASYGTTASAVLNNVYEEVGNCSSPLLTGEAGLIVEGGYARITGGVGPAGKLPQFANLDSNTGNSQYNIYIVAHSSTLGTSPPYLAGTALTNGSGKVLLTWNEIGRQGTITYDVLATLGAGAQTPVTGTAAFAIATGIAASSCHNQVCQLVYDTSVPLASYTVAPASYAPTLRLWPGNVILTSIGDEATGGTLSPSRLYTDLISAGGIVNGAGALQPSVFAQECQAGTNWSPVWVQCVGTTTSGNLSTTLQMGTQSGLKGRLMFDLPQGGLGSTHIITLSDSNPTKTLAMSPNRPPYDVRDTYIGYDQSSPVSSTQTQLSFGAPVSISNYIANAGDNVSWLERLTASSKILKVPLQVAEVRTGIAANSDAAGTLIISGGNSATYTFSGKYASSPSCTLTPLADPSATGAYWASITPLTLTANVKMAGTMSFSYHCWGLT